MIELKDIVSMTLGSTGLVISVVNLARSVGSDRKTRELTFATEKQNALVLLREEQLSLEGKALKLENIVTSAYAVKAEILVEEANNFKEHFQSQATTFANLLAGFDRYPSKSAKHADLVSMREGSIAKLRQLQAERLQKDYVFENFCQQAQEMIDNFRKAWALRINPNKEI